MTNYVTAIKRLRPGAAFTINGNTYGDIVWHDTQTTQPTEQEILDEVAAFNQRETKKANDKVEFRNDSDRKNFWDKAEDVSKAEFKQYLEDYIVDQASAKRAIIGLAMEVARLRTYAKR